MGLLLAIVVLVLFLGYLVADADEKKQQIQSSGYQFRIEPEPTISNEKRLLQSDACWVPPGEERSLAGATLPGGMVYIGKRMAGAGGYGGEPGCINPALPVSANHGAILESSLNYWPSYEQANPSDRRSYLNWLATGRREPDADISYVFLFYYGLERRLLFDGTHLARVVGPEVLSLVDELETLLATYGDSRSFSNYCGSLLAWVKTEWSLWEEPNKLRAPEPQRRHSPTEAITVALGHFCAAATPLPADWALAWLYMHPHVKLRTPANRCPEEFQELFKIRYSERYGDGILIRPLKRRIRLRYHPASSGFGYTDFSRQTDLPDVSTAKGPANKLLKVSDAVQDELDSFSRWVGKHEDRSSAAAIARLPVLLAESRSSVEGKKLSEWLEATLATSQTVVVPTAELLALWPGANEGRVTAQEARVLADFLSRRGIGMEPDLRYGGRNPSTVDKVAIYRREIGDEAPGNMYNAAALLLQLGVAVAAADGEIDESEERHLETSLEDSLALSAADRLRLRAHIARLLADPPGLTGVKSQARELTIESRKAAARFLIGVAAADGKVTPEEINLLRRIYRSLDLDPDAVFGEIHALAAGSVDIGPVPVVTGATGPKGHAIPPDASGIVTLDLERVKQIRIDTHDAAVLLGQIFGDDHDSQDQAEPDEKDDEELIDSDKSGDATGLDQSHSAALDVLAGRAVWPRSELRDIAEEHGLMTGGLIETINEAAFRMAGEALLEGDDPVELNSYALEIMLK